jgi:hypothetical protein
MDKITQILENVVRCKYFEAGVHIKNPIKNSCQDDLGRTTQTLDHVVVVHILNRDKRKSQINEYSDLSYVLILINYRNSALQATITSISILIVHLYLKVFWPCRPLEADLNIAGGSLVCCVRQVCRVF